VAQVCAFFLGTKLLATISTFFPKFWQPKAKQCLEKFFGKTHLANFSPGTGFLAHALPQQLPSVTCLGDLGKLGSGKMGAGRGRGGWRKFVEVCRQTNDTRAHAEEDGAAVGEPEAGIRQRLLKFK
jgi:hypothetical protein